MEINVKKGLEKLAAVETALAAFDWKEDFSIYGGKCGYLLFLNELARFRNAGDVYEPQMTALCEGIFNDVQQEGADPSFASGLAGLVFTLSRLGLTELVDEPIFECIDRNAYDSSKRDNFDFIYGSAGMVYSLSEAEYTNPYFYNTWLNLIETKLGKFPDGYRLPVRYNGHPFSQNDFQYNNSLSHGMLAILVVIAGILEKKQADNKYEAVAEKIIDSLLAMRNPDVTHEHGFFPPIIKMDNTRQYFKRFSWCYGDLGVALMLNRFAKYTGKTIYRDTTIEILDHYLQYTHPDEADVKDADLCHGAAGIAVVYLFFYHEFGDERYRNMANRWFNIMLEMDIYSDGAAGYKHYDPAGSYNNYGLLEGISGIGLTLITFLSGEKCSWQSALLIQ